MPAEVMHRERDSHQSTGKREMCRVPAALKSVMSDSCFVFGAASKLFPCQKVNVGYDRIAVPPERIRG